MSLNLRIGIAFLFAFALSILPLPDWLLQFRPNWILLLILYVQYYLPSYFSFWLLLFVGFILDVLLSSVLGEHAFALSFLTLLASNRIRRFTFFSVGQQMIIIFSFCFFYQLLIGLIDSFLGYHVNFIAATSSAIISALLWPWVRLIADDALLKGINQNL